MKEGEELEHPWLNRSVETAQKRVEQRNYLMRRRTLEFDDVMNQQREVIYGYRNEVMDVENPRALIHEVITEAVPKKVAEFLTTENDSEPDVTGLLQWLNTTFPLGLTAEKCAFESRSIEENGRFVREAIIEAYDRKAAIEDAAARSGLEKYVILNAVDRLWQEHLYAMDSLREAVYLRAYGQKDPLTEYKTEAYAIFVELMESIKNEVLNNLFRSTTNLQAFEQLLASLPQHLMQRDLLEPSQGGIAAQSQNQLPPSAPSAPGSAASAEMDRAFAAPQPKKEAPRVGRNDPCVCGSGKKYKSCCGRTA
jgi:preprotein translocase subunit SecA